MHILLIKLHFWPRMFEKLHIGPLFAFPDYLDLCFAGKLHFGPRWFQNCILTCHMISKLTPVHTPIKKLHFNPAFCKIACRPSFPQIPCTKAPNFSKPLHLDPHPFKNCIRDPDLLKNPPWVFSCILHALHSCILALGTPCTHLSVSSSRLNGRTYFAHP